MWARIEFRVRSAVRSALATFGTPPLSAALGVLLLARAAAVEVWGRVGAPGASGRFATSWTAWLLAFAIVADAAVHLRHRLPDAFPAWFPPRPAVDGARREAIGAMVLALAWLLVGAGVVTSLASKDRFTLWAGVGELVDGRPGQYVSRDDPRPLSPGPRPLSFTVDTVSPRVAAGEEPTSLDVRVSVGASSKSTSPWRPVWLGGSRFLRATGYGYAPRFEVLDPHGRVVDGAFVKVDIVPPGRSDEIRSDVLPHRFSIRLAPRPGPGDRSPPAAGPAFDVDVYREKLLVASGRVRIGEPLGFEGLTFRIPEVNYVARFVLVDDPGVLVLVLAAATAIVGLALRRRGMNHRAPSTVSPD